MLTLSGTPTITSHLDKCTSSPNIFILFQIITCTCTRLPINQYNADTIKQRKGQSSISLFIIEEIDTNVLPLVRQLARCLH